MRCGKCGGHLGLAGMAGILADTVRGRGRQRVGPTLAGCRWAMACSRPRVRPSSFIRDRLRRLGFGCRRWRVHETRGKEVCDSFGFLLMAVGADHSVVFNNAMCTAVGVPHSPGAALPLGAGFVLYVRLITRCFSPCPSIRSSCGLGHRDRGFRGAALLEGQFRAAG